LGFCFAASIRSRTERQGLSALTTSSIGSTAISAIGVKLRQPVSELISSGRFRLCGV